jgi:RNA polymerase sigma-70 factor (ECF subfamily)
MGQVPDDDERKRFESLYEDYRLQVLAYCMRRASSADAPDVCSETFLVAWRRLADIPQPPETLPYIYGIAARVLANQTRALRRRARLERKLQSLGVVVAPDPATLVLRSARNQEVAAAVRRLKSTDREIVMLYAWEELPRQMIAQMMGMTRAAVDQRIHRSYQRLARILEPALDTPTTHSPPIAERGGT